MKKISNLFTLIKWALVFTATKVFNLKEKQYEYKVKNLEAGDQHLASLKEKAQSQIDYFIDFLCENGKAEGSYEYFIKAPFDADDHSEHMWVDVSSYINGVFNGRLTNEPKSVSWLKYGDVVQVNKDDVEDWILNDHVLLAKVGGFSQKYLRG